jgi:hypothetical protein
MTPQNRNDKNMTKPNDKKNIQQPSEFAGKIFITLVLESIFALL